MRTRRWCQFWWPDLTGWVTAYVQGCTSCQQNKPQNHPRQTPQFRIPTRTNALPFQTIGLDLITQLPPSRGADAILTIVDHGCSWAAIFLPCKATITGEGVAKLYMEHVYRWFGLPQKVISDRDPRFTSHFAKGLTRTLGIQQNISTAFHPQTDRLTERKNQWVEGYLRHLTMAQQDDWADWLAVATAVHNHPDNVANIVQWLWESPLQIVSIFVGKPTSAHLAKIAIYYEWAHEDLYLIVLKGPRHAAEFMLLIVWNGLSIIIKHSANNIRWAQNMPAKLSQMLLNGPTVAPEGSRW